MTSSVSKLTPGILLLLTLALSLPAKAQTRDVGENDPLEGVPEQFEPIVTSYDRQDPWENMNRRIFGFNDVIDRYFLKPVAQVYLDYTPGLARQGVTNFFSNLEEPINLVNNLLQLKGEGALITTGRLVFNSTFGLLGLIDVATSFGLPEQGEDFGQTLGYWGVDSGPYLVLPFLGPSTIRDTSRFVADSQIPTGYHAVESPDVYFLIALRGIETRARLIPAEGALIGDDRYRAIRNAYLQQRNYKVNDGVVEDPFAAGDDALLEDF